MNNNIKNILISFTAGLGIGISCGKIYYEKKYRMKLNGAEFKSDSKDLEEAKKMEADKKDNSEETQVKEKDPKEASEINKNKEDISTMAKKVQEENPRFDYSTPAPIEVKHEMDPSIEEDFVIEPEDFGERKDEDYEVVRVLCLADCNFVYENGDTFEPVEEPARKIGKEAIRMLKNGEANDVMYVRNNRIKIDYEILQDDRTLNECLGIDDEEDTEDEEDEE